MGYESRKINLSVHFVEINYENRRCVCVCVASTIFQYPPIYPVFFLKSTQDKTILCKYSSYVCVCVLVCMRLLLLLLLLFLLLSMKNVCCAYGCSQRACTCVCVMTMMSIHTNVYVCVYISKGEFLIGTPFFLH